MRQAKNAGATPEATSPGREDAETFENGRSDDAAVDPEVLALLDDDMEMEDEEEDEFAGGGLTAEDKVRLMAQTADAVKAEDIIALDVHELTIITDYFLICTGKSSIQIRAISDRIEEKLRNAGERKLRVEGRQEATWVLMDYGDVVVHIMAAEQRDFYRLEELWSEAPQLELELLPA